MSVIAAPEITADAESDRRPRRAQTRLLTLGIASAVLLILVLLAIFAPLVARYNPDTPVTVALSPPSSQHWFGSDELGRDVLSRVIWGGRIPFLVSAVSVLIATAVGVTLGLIGGYAAGLIGGFIMRCMDVLLAFPALILGFAVIAIIGIGPTSMIIAISVAFVPVFARISYTSTLSIKREDFVTIARGLGLPASRILIRHVLRNLASEIAVVASSSVGWALLLEAALEFLGMGTRPPTPDWGADLSAAGDYIASGSWWVMFGPGLAITLAILCSNLIGDDLAHLLGARSSRVSLGRLLRVLTGTSRRRASEEAAGDA